MRFCIGLPDLKEESGQRLALFVPLLTAKKCEQLEKGMYTLMLYFFQPPPPSASVSVDFNVVLSLTTRWMKLRAWAISCPNCLPRPRSRDLSPRRRVASFGFCMMTRNWATHSLAHSVHYWATIMGSHLGLRSRIVRRANVFVLKFNLLRIIANDVFIAIP